MATGTQKSAGFIEGIPVSTNGDAFRPRTCYGRGTPRAPGCISRCGGAANGGSRSDADGRSPAAHPATDAAPVQPAAAGHTIVIDGDYDFVVVAEGASTRLVVAKVVELQAHSRVHEEDTGGAEEEGSRAKDPVGAHTARGRDPARVLAWGVVEPGAGVGEKRRRVEEIAEEGSREEGGTEACSGFTDLVLVELR